jgi:hypothetical protein
MRTTTRFGMVRYGARALRCTVFIGACAFVAACARDMPTSASGFGRGIRLQAFMSTSAASPVSFNRARVVFRSALGGVALDTTVALADDGVATALGFAVPLGPVPIVTGELFTIVVSCITPAGDTVYRGGPVLVVLSPFTQSAQATIVLRPVGTLLPLDSLPILDSIPLVDSIPIVDSAVALVVSAVSGDAQSGLVGALLGTPLRVLVTNRAGQAVSGVSIAWAVPLGGGILASATSVTDASGIAQNTLRLGLLPGLNVVTATVGSLAPVIFDLTGALSLLGASSYGPHAGAFTPAAASTGLRPAPESVALSAVSFVEFSSVHRVAAVQRSRHAAAYPARIATVGA